MFDYPILGFIDKIPNKIYEKIKNKYVFLGEGQAKAINKGLFDHKNLLVAIPTGAGKSLIGNLAMLNSRLNKKQSIYISPLKSLTNEQFTKFRDDYKKDFGGCILSTGDYNKGDIWITKSYFIFTTAEKLDVLIRKNKEFIDNIGCVIIDELHTLNDVSRGATLEIVITMIRHLNPNIQIIGLSATIGNLDQVAKWLNAELVHSDKRPVELKKAIYLNGFINYYE